MDRDALDRHITGNYGEDQFSRQEECEDEIFHVQCHHCDITVDPHEDPVYCWNFYTAGGHGSKQIFVCGGCDAEHRTNYKAHCNELAPFVKEVLSMLLHQGLGDRAFWEAHQWACKEMEEG